MPAANERRAEFRLGELLGEDDLAELRTALPPGEKSAYARHYFVSSWSAEQEDRFGAMADACMKLAHPTLAPVLGYGVSRERPFLVYERHPSISLRELLRHTSELPAQSATWLLTRVAIALDLVPPDAHGAICPDSILLNREAEVEVRDLGMVALGTRGGLGTKSEIVAGYCAPEIIDGAEPNASASVFALGVCVYEALMGDRPFRGRTMLANLVHARMGKFQRIDEHRAPAELRDIVHRMLAADPTARPTIAELTRDGARLAWRDSRPDNLGAMVRQWIPPEEPRPEAPPVEASGPRSTADDTAPSVSLPPDPCDRGAPSSAPSAPAPGDVPIWEAHPAGWEGGGEDKTFVEWDAGPVIPTVVLEAPPDRGERDGLRLTPLPPARLPPSPLPPPPRATASTRTAVIAAVAALAIFDLLLVGFLVHVIMS